VVEGVGRGADMKPRLVDVLRTLGAPEPRGRRIPAWWRGGDHHSVALNLERDLWHDHARGVGGGVVKLVQTVLACSRRDALYWLQLRFGWPPERRTTPAERKEYAQRREAAKYEAKKMLLWHMALLAELIRTKARTYNHYLERPSAETEQAWENACRHSFFVEKLTSAELVRAFQKARRRARVEVDQLIAAGREDELNAKRCTAQLVTLIALAAQKEARDAA